jgi:hypothetical protein
VNNTYVVFVFNSFVDLRMMKEVSAVFGRF